MSDAQPITGCRPDDIARHVFLCGDPARVARISEGWTRVREVCEVREYRIVTGDLDGLRAAADKLRGVLEAMNYRNLDDEPDFAGKNTTTEFLAREIYERLARATKAGELGEGARGVSSICVTLNESHVAWGSYEGNL